MGATNSKYKTKNKRHAYAAGIYRIYFLSLQ